MSSILLDRRSIRAYTEQVVEKEKIDKVLEAGMSAPSAGNQRCWEFIVVNDRELLDKIPTVHSYASMVPKAQVAVIICGNLRKEKIKNLWVQDCSAATQNMLLACTENGLGAVWLGVYPTADRVEGISQLFSLPEHIIPLSVIPIGYPAEVKSKKDLSDKSCIHYNSL